jgi:hypothetical protein
MAQIYDLTSILKVDNVDKDGWRWYDPNDYRDAIVRQFIEGLHGTDDKYRHVIRHFHDSVNDKQIQAVIRYFNNCCYAEDAGFFGDEDHMEVLKNLYYRGSMSKRMVFFGFDKNNWYNDYRITGVRLLSRTGWKISRTIFTVDKSVYNWSKNRTIFDR